MLQQQQQQQKEQQQRQQQRRQYGLPNGQRKKERSRENCCKTYFDWQVAIDCRTKATTRAQLKLLNLIARVGRVLRQCLNLKIDKTCNSHVIHATKVKTKTRTKSKKRRDHDAEEDVVVYDFTRGTVRQQLVGLQGGSLFDLLGEGRLYINRDTEMGKGLNRLKVASLCDDDNATKVQRNKQLGWEYFFLRTYQALPY